ncbi:MAG: terpene cyclase/mutase family protein, partial [Candidatus Diapherotrites archaeon]|nr:terpene cyclase/mutase family protein [Candidatus Diapherotrites archaeon]
LWGLELITPTAMALITLMYTSRKTKSMRYVIEDGCKWLISRQFKSGGFRAENANRANAGMTSLSLWAMSRANNMYGSELSCSKELLDSVERAGQFMRSAQRRDGSFPSTPGMTERVDGLIAVSKTYATAEDLCGFVEYAAHKEAEIGNTTIHRGLRWLMRSQNKDGGWGHMNRTRVEETAYAILLAQQLVNKKIDYPAYILAAQKGLGKLISMQKEGHWHKDYRHTATFNTAFSSMVIPKEKVCEISA